jgi:hypothetical protein
MLIMRAETYESSLIYQSEKRIASQRTAAGESAP